ncbi:hypothetical protein ACIBX9_09565 [Streptomyces albidoflavus]
MTMLIGTKSQQDFTGPLDDRARETLTGTSTRTCSVAISTAKQSRPPA